MSDICNCNFLEKFRKSEYEYDAFRNTQSERYIFEAIRIKTNKLGIGFSSSEILAVDNAKKAFDLEYEETFIEYDNELDQAKYEVDLNMQKLISKRGIIAGLPWFYQTWARDEMISSIYLINKGRYTELKIMFEKYFKFEYMKGFPAILPGEGIPSADGAGWMYKRFDDFLETLMRENKLEEIYSSEELIKISKFLQEKFKYIEDNLMKEELVHSGYNETWMDTSFTDDGRAGFCIEIQALTAKMLSTIYTLTNKEEYKQKELVLKNKVKEKFFENENICDHLMGNKDKNSEIRPNFFIAMYIYPRLFNKEEWENIIDNSLPKIWLEWGGLSSIEKESKLFKDNYTGENNASYHRGDSWYFINCMAAICMIKINKEKYSEKINSIVNACLKEINSNGVIGALAEVSSAKELNGYGCLSQAWSNALFLELLDLL